MHSQFTGDCAQRGPKIPVVDPLQQRESIREIAAGVADAAAGLGYITEDPKGITMFAAMYRAVGMTAGALQRRS
ncbi:MAG: hypothetical protein U1F76_21000 [Candidatus Competibacteraceae bacterium]